MTPPSSATASYRNRCDVLVVGTAQYGLLGKGKMPRYFRRPFSRALRSSGADVRYYETPGDLLRERDDFRDPIVVLVYNEDIGSTIAEMREFEDTLRASFDNPYVVNCTAIGAIIGDKTATNLAYSKAGVPVPALDGEGSQTGKIFSNSAIGSKRPVKLCEDLSEAGNGSYNTSFINTVHEFRGSQYYVCLRAMAFMDRVIAVYVRARPVMQTSPSVHSKDTPLDPPLIAHLYEKLARARKKEIRALGAHAGSLLGPGFYAHDILPCADTGRLYICETGFKFADNTLRVHLNPIRDELPMLAEIYSLKEAKRFAWALGRHLREIGRLPPLPATESA